MYLLQEFGQFVMKVLSPNVIDYILIKIVISGYMGMPCFLQFELPRIFIKWFHVNLF